MNTWLIVGVVVVVVSVAVALVGRSERPAPGETCPYCATLGKVTVENLRHRRFGRSGGGLFRDLWAKRLRCVNCKTTWLVA